LPSLAIKIYLRTSTVHFLNLVQMICRLKVIDRYRATIVSKYMGGRKEEGRKPGKPGIVEEFYMFNLVDTLILVLLLLLNVTMIE